MERSSSFSSVAHASWQAASGISHAVFAIEGMRCSACSHAVTRAVDEIPGVKRISVNIATGRASVDWDPRRVSLSGVLDVIAKTGFKPVPLAGESASAEQRAERRVALKRIGLAGLGMMQTMMFVYCIYAAGTHGIDPAIAQYLKLAGLLIATPVLVYSGAPFFIRALRDLRRGTLGMDVPVALALALAYGASVINTLRGAGEIYFDSVTMFIFFLLAGRFVEMTVRQRNLSATEALARSLPSTVTRIARNGATERIAPRFIKPGDLLSIPKGAVVPVDAMLAEGEAVVDESLLTGEAISIPKRAHQPLLGGSINVGHPIRVVAKTRASDSMLANIVSLLERAQAERASITRTADRIASWFVLLTVTLATLAAAFWLFVEPVRALPAALAVLVVTCPCALSLATPAAVAAATTRLARLGLLVTRPDALERLARADLVIVDKTGTLTHGVPAVELTGIRPGHTRGEVLEVAAALESASDHPVALAFRPLFSPGRAASVAKEFVGRGVEGVVDGTLWRLGTYRFAAELIGSGAPVARPTNEGASRSTCCKSDAAGETSRLSAEPLDDSGTDIVLGNSDGVVATFVLDDSLRSDAVRAVEQLRAMGLQVAIASGDHDRVVKKVARKLGIQDCAGRLTPQQKLALIQQRQSAGASVLMVGDGINDGPVLAAAYVSCAMGHGSAVAQAAADLLLLNESLVTLAEAVRTARRMRAVIRQNLVWALTYNLAAVPLAAFGWIPPWVAAIGMSTSSLLVVLNAARLARAITPAVVDVGAGSLTASAADPGAPIPTTPRRAHCAPT
jgi:Cu2+-exporting ATPase